MKMNDQFNERELTALLRELRFVLGKGIPGDVVELGCYKGLTSLEIQRALHNGQSDKRLYLYDSFAGLPPKAAQDNSPAGMQFKAGELPASKAEVINIFKKSGLSVPRVKKAWFKDLTEQDIPHQVAFAFLDGDFYESITDSLKLIWPYLTSGSVVIVDDYQNEALPGAQRAVSEWLKGHPAKLKVEASLAIIQIA
jgi:O-methyltransferase